MSLAATTSTALTLIDAPSLKLHATTADTKLFPIPAPPIASAWTPDNQTLYVASTHAIYAFSAVSSQFTSVFTAAPDAPLEPLLAVRDSSTVVFTQGTTIHLLATSARPPKIISSLTAHSAPVTSLALSSDATLLASASSAGTLHVYNLAHNANSVLRSFPGALRARCVCMFDPHVRTRLFVGAGTTLAIYDTARSGGPVKTIAIAEKGASVDTGHVVAISSSPYSKTLVAVACTSFIGVVDLDKEKLLKTIPMKTPITSMTFTTDGSAIIFGTESGKVMLQDLRIVDRVHRTFDVGKGDRIIAFSIQKRIKGSPSASSLTTARLPTSRSVPLTSHELNNAKSPVRRTVSSRAPLTPAKGGTRKEEGPKRAFSPPRAPVRGGTDDAGDISVQIETLIGIGSNAEGSKKQGTMKSDMKPQQSSAAVLVSTSSSNGGIPLERPSSRLTVEARSRSRKSSFTPSDASAPADARLAPRTRAGSRSSDVPPSEAVAPAPTLLSAPTPSNRTSDGSTIRTARTPTPDLPSIDEAESPLWKSRAQGLKGAHNQAGFLTTPDMERWVEAGRGPAKQQDAPKSTTEKRVGWADSDSDSSDKENAPDAGDDDVTVAAPKDKGKSPVYTSSAPSPMDMSPIRRPHLSSGAMQISPLRSSPLRGQATSGNGGAQELLRAVVKDIMYDYRQETREDIKGLHLDLLKMGRNWKSELRTMMDEYVGDLRELREENARLRTENDRLRRGF